MEKKLNEKKLRLNKETIRNLSDESLDQAAGGARKNSVVLVSACQSCACGNNSVVCTILAHKC